MEKGDYRISNIYQGGYSTFDSGYQGKIAAGSFGTTTDPRTANILQEVSTKLSSGVKNIEVEGVSPEIFDSIPKQQLKEVHRLAKLTGIDISMHGPVIDVSGIDPRGGFSEPERETAQRKVAEALLRAHDLNPEGNIHVNFHTAEGIPGSQFLPPSKRKEEEIYKKLIVIDKETGRLAPLEPETDYYPGTQELEKGEGTYRSPEQRMKNLNLTSWDNSINQLFFNQERAKEILEKTRPFIEHFIDPKTGTIKEEDFHTLPSQVQKQIANNFKSASNYLQEVHQHVNALFSKAYKYGTHEQQDALKRISYEFGKKIEGQGQNPFTQAEIMGELLNDLKRPEYIPEIYVPIEKFATETSSKTFGNAAWQAYSKYKDTSPVLVIENPPAGFALSTGQDVRKVVEESRKQFIENAKNSGMSESEARKTAEKIIGATWDVGHINMLRKQGYSEEEVIKEAEKIAPVLKHVHLSDNFGFEHTELPMGMGNVPLKEIMQKLGQKGYDATKIIEAGNWWQHFRTQPFQEVLEATGSPIYSMKMAPYWNEAGNLYQGYSGGFEGKWLPQVNYETFGTTFSRLPAELGGQFPGAQGSRMSGRPME